jgi:hypothetical protein
LSIEKGVKRMTRFSVHIPLQIVILKVPKREIFLTELSILSVPIWIGKLRAEPKKTFV